MAVFLFLEGIFKFCKETSHIRIQGYEWQREEKEYTKKFRDECERKSSHTSSRNLIYWNTGRYSASSKELQNDEGLTQKIKWEF